MGCDTHYFWERPRHRVWIDAFEMACTAVTHREYALFLAASEHEKPAGWEDPAFSGPDQPVVGVSWFDAVSYCNWFSNLSGTTYRLPTEAEWEKACRGGMEDADYAWGGDPPNTIPSLGGVWNGPRRVASWHPNAYGLFDMGTNVHEWCLDWYKDDYYVTSAERNPSGPETGSRRVSRGGSWRHQIKASRAAHRSSLPPAYRYTDYGFRLVRQIARDSGKRLT
jgi:sulfatase modifying factor 1